MSHPAPEVESGLNERGEPSIYIEPLQARATAFEILGDLDIRLHSPAGAVDLRLSDGAEVVRQAMADGGQLHVFEVLMPASDEGEPAEILSSEFEQRVSAYVIGPAPRR
ncbi:hypothetical protein [Methylobacterium brachiatum]|jgi:hypothetical protein